MDRKETIAKRKSKQNLPPKRGQVKMRIFKSIAEVLSCSGRIRQEEEEEEEERGSVPLSSTSTTPPIPSGYTSEA
ncbi:hypothetical protein Lal_00003326 [Lupinus albus]|uniref:Uncharacterized protein n=1 Tax=Lupinus albus TaxID=3870 RepID=A0A6A5NIQ7_LUPAL|nr:hypothetical protein Lalb_Chr22g0350131 [Lupinus albus]KAF1883143.1 hypothetical protein Lal_00003326 [Lupinus albus]